MATRTRKLPSSKRSAPVFRFRKFGIQLKEKIKNLARRGVNSIDKKPLTSFFIVLAIILALIIIGSFLRKPKKEITVNPPEKDVQVYSIGSAPTVKVQAQIEKSGIIKIVALTPGIVSQINITEGQKVEKGTVLIGLSSNYQGGNAASVSREIAAATYNNTKDVYNIQKDVIAKQRDIAKKTDENADNLRDITSKSLDDTRSLLNADQDIITTLNSSLQALQNNNQNGQNDATILQTRQLIAQYQSAITQLQASARPAEYQSTSDKTPAQLSDMARDLAFRQLDIQEKALTLSLEVSRLSFQMAQIQEATMFPAAPFSGVVERVFVKIGENVNPGTPLAVLHGAQTLKAVAKVPRDVAQKVSLVESSKIRIGDKTYTTTPIYVSSEATDGSLYSVLFSIPEDYQNAISDNEYLTIEMPVGFASTSTAIPFIPIDTIYQSATDSYVFVVKNGKAETKKIKLGSVVGQYAEVISGLTSGDEVILSRSVVSGDIIKAVR